MKGGSEWVWVFTYDGVMVQDGAESWCQPKWRGPSDKKDTMNVFLLQLQD